MEIPISIPCDVDGYATFECPFCNSTFKLQADEYDDDESPVIDLFCPYCGLTHGKNQFINSEVLEYTAILAENYMIDFLNGTFKNMQSSINKSSSILKMSYKPLKHRQTNDLSEKDSVEM